MNKDLTRRSVLKTFAAGAAISMISGGISYAKDKSVKKIVVLGGGYGGSTAAKYIKMIDPSIDVTLIDRNASHISCAMSNEVVFAMDDISSITFPHKTLADRYGVNFRQAEVTGLDPNKKIVKTSNGDFPYDKLIVAPGVSMDYDEKAGFDKKFQEETPHAWIAGPQTLQLRKQLETLKKGGTVLMRTPKAPYRCPPGPYERASLMGDLAKKLGGKVVVLDPNPGIVSKAPLFKAGFEELYKDVLTYIPNTTVKSYDAAKRTIVTDKGNFTGDVINFVPDMKAGELAFTLGLVPKGGKWAAVDPVSFESKIIKDVYVAGDAIDSSITEMPKSGVVANGMGKTIALNAVRALNGKEPLPPIIGNSCYSLVSPTEGIYIASVYEYDPKVNKIVVKNGANGIPPKRTEENARNIFSWAENIFADTFK